MAGLPSPLDRMRVWIFANFRKDSDFTVSILRDYPNASIWTTKKFFEMGGDDYVIVRADKVQPISVGGKECHFVIPVDAEGEDGLVAARNAIAELGFVDLTEVRVVSHNPWPPHQSHGFITQNEINHVPDDKVGRQSHRSPGSNKWG